MKRLFDIFFSLLFLIALSPAFIIVSFLIIMIDGTPVFYSQKRIGKDFKEFLLIKFRTMKKGSDKLGQVTSGKHINQITKTGEFLRKSKWDEIPQLINILFGDMSFVGPRPEVKKFVDLYTEQQKKVLSIRPGLTDFASIKYANENEILSNQADPEKYYVDVIMQDKIKIYLDYINRRNFLLDLQIIWKTIVKVLAR